MKRAKSRKARPIHTLLFHDRSLVDAAVEVSKYRSMSDFRPRILRDLGLTEADVRNSPFTVLKDVIERGLKMAQDTDDELYGQVPNRVSDALLADMWEAAAAYAAKNVPELVEAVRRSEGDGGMSYLHNYVLANVIMLNRQASFLWFSFKESRPCIDMVTKEACELVNSTKLDAGVTKEMLDDAFAEDRYVCMSSSSVDGFREIACMKRGSRLSVVCGQSVDGDTVLVRKGFSNQPFSVVGSLNLDELAGRMTERNMRENGREMQRLSDSDSIRDISAKVWGEESEEHAEERYRISGEIATDLVAFVLKLRLLLGMEKTPVARLRTQEGSSVSLDGVSTPPGKRGISYSVVSLTREFVKARSEWRAEGGRLDRFGKDLVAKQIAGFIRRQHYGEGNKLEKFVYIAPFTNRFWVNSGVRLRKIVK